MPQPQTVTCGTCNLWGGAFDLQAGGQGCRWFWQSSKDPLDVVCAEAWQVTLFWNGSIVGGQVYADIEVLSGGPGGVGTPLATDNFLFPVGATPIPCGIAYDFPIATLYPLNNGCELVAGQEFNLVPQ